MPLLRSDVIADPDRRDAALPGTGLHMGSAKDPGDWWATLGSGARSPAGTWASYGHFCGSCPRRRVQARAGVWRAQACAKGCGAMSWLGGWRFYTLFSEAHARGSRPGLQGLSARVAMVAMDARDAFDQSESCRKQ